MESARFEVGRAVRVMQEGDTETERENHWFASIGNGKGREGGREIGGIASLKGAIFRN